MANRLCPLCIVPLQPRPMHGYEIDICPECEGMFFEFGELLVAKENLDDIKHFQTIQQGDDQKDHVGEEYKCPGCQFDLREMEYEYDSGIHIDQCYNCHGIFLEKGELIVINNYLESAASSPEAQQRMLQAAAVLQQTEAKMEAERRQSIREADNFYEDDDGFVANKATEFLLGNLL